MREAVAVVVKVVGAFTPFMPELYPRLELYEYWQVVERRCFGIRHNGVRKMRRLIVEQVREAAEALRKDDSDDIHVLEVDF